MKGISRLFAVLVLLAPVGFAKEAPHRIPDFDIRQPTIIAFFLPMTQNEENSGPGDTEALDDFNFYALKVQKRLNDAGVNFKQVSGNSFRIRRGKTTRTVRAGKSGVGYCFVAPGTGRGPHVEYGVMTDEDLLVVARKYFGKAIP